MDMLQSHLLDRYMLNMAKDHFVWPGIKEELKNLYKKCESCLMHASSKPEEAYDVKDNSSYDYILRGPGAGPNKGPGRVTYSIQTKWLLLDLTLTNHWPFHPDELLLFKSIIWK